MFIQFQDNTAVIDDLIEQKVKKLLAIKERNNTVRAVRDIVIKKNNQDYREEPRAF